MSAIVPLKKRKRPAAVAAQGGEEREYPWPLLSSKSCHHLDWYPMLVKGDVGDGTDDYECEVCALCGSVRGLRRVQGGRQTPMLKGIWLVKAAGGGYVDWKNDPRYRWITLRPHGEDGEGYPVLIRMDDASGEKGSGTIVGGAGGSMNYRRVTGVRSKADYRTEARSRRAERESKAEARVAKRVQEARDAGLSDADLAEAERQRKEARKQLQEQAALAEAEHLANLAEIMGWEVPALSEAQVEGMTTKTKDRIERERRRRMLKEAEKAVQNVQDSVIKEHDRAVTEAIGHERVEDLAFEEVDDRGLGYVAKVETLAKEAGMTKAEARALSRATTDASLERAEDEGYIKSAIKARMYIDMLQQAGADARTEDKPFRERGLHKVGEAPEHLEPDQARALLVAHEQYKQKQREFQAKEREITDAAPQNVVDVAVVTRGDALVRMGKMTDEEAMAKVEESLQARARITAADRLLSRIEELEGGVESVEQHLLEGRHVQLQEVAQAVFSQPLTMRREVLDLLGPEAGATLMAHIMRRELADEDREAVRTALREEHIETQVDRARTALEDAQEHFEAAQAAFAGFGTVGELGAEGLEAASAAKAEKLRELREARQILGVTLGRLQMLGSMNAALAEGEGRTLDVPLGQITGAQAWQVGAALGLARGEYEVQSDGPNKYIRITHDAFGKLIESPDPEQKEQYEAAVAIKRGDFDEDGWLAEGLMKRPSEKYYDDPDFTAGWGVDAAEILDGKYGAGLEAGLREYAGKMIANGGAAGVQSLRMKMFSAEWQADNLDDFQRQQFADAMRAVFPVEGADDNWVSVAEDLVKPFVEQSNAERAALDAQNIDIVSARDPIHRALQEVPEGKVAFTPLSRLTPQGKDLIRDYFWRRLVIDEKRPEAAETKERNEEIEQKAEEVVGAQGFMFDMPPVSEEERASFVARGAGEESEEERAARLARVSEGSTELAGGEREIKRGETEAFQEKLSAEEVERRDNAWARYVRALKGTGNAYATVQAVIQGELAESFAKHYGRETGRGLRTAPADVPNSLRHVIGLLPKDALERVLDADNGALREMYEGLRRRDTRGRYSEGEVANLAVRILEKAKKMQLTLFGDASPGAQRLSIGSTAEKQLKQAWAQVAPHFDPERPAHIIENLAQSGPKYVHQQRAIKMLEKAKRIGLHHSTGCVAGATVLVDPLTGEQKTVREHYEQRTYPRVLSVRQDGSFAVADADVPFVKGATRLLTVRTEAGREVTVAPDHLFLTEEGWRRAADLAPRDSLCAVAAATESDAIRSACETSHNRSRGGRISPSATGRPARSACEAPLGLHRPEACEQPRGGDASRTLTTAALDHSAPRPGAPRLTSTGAGCRGHCSDGLRPGDARPHGASADAPSAPTSRGDAPARSRCAVRSDGPADARERSHPARCGGLRPTPDYALRAGRDRAKGYRTSREDAEARSRCSRVRGRSLTGSSAHRGTCGAGSVHRVRTAAACLALAGCLARAALARRASYSNREPLRSSRLTCALPREPRLPAVSRPCPSPPTAVRPQPVMCSIPVWDRVSTVTEAEVEEYFDFEVPVHHNYVAHGLVHHNSGKSLASLGAFTHLHSQGKVQRGLYMVPPKVQAQFGGEINAYAEPGRYSHFSDPSASAKERRAAYADPGRQMVVISHQAWRDDVTWAVAQERFGGNEQEAADWLRTAERGETAEAVRAAVDAQGWKFDMNVVDEGHDTLNRKGKPDSRLARVIDATTDRAEYMMTMTATPVKNDPSEVYDLLRKVRPDKFPADGYEAFRRRYALNTEANREALQRLVAPYFYAKNVDTGVQERHSYTGTDLSPWQKERYRQVLEDYNTARSAPEGSDERREAIRALVPDESLRDLSPEQVAQKLDDLGGALGFTRDRAIARVLEHAPAEHNPRIQKVVEIVKRHAGKDDDGGQVPGLIFSQSLESVRLLADALKKEGLRVGVITGELSGADSELRRMDFNADGGRGKGDDLAQEAATRRKMAKYDIIVGSGAAGTGLNMERARFLVHYDQPWTAKEIAQRNGRQNRLSQHWGEVEVHTLGTDVPYDRKRRELVERKRGLMTTFMEPTEQLDDTGLARRIREARAERLSNAAEVAMGVGERRRPAGGVPMQEAAT